MIGYIVDAISSIRHVIDGDVTLSDLFSLVYNVFFKAILLFIKDFFSKSKDFFIELGDDITSMFGSQSFTDYWLFWILGIFVGIFLIKYVIAAVIEFVSKLLDIT